jgi:hypothetical protein
MVSSVGLDATGITDKSFKMLGVTRTVNKGAALDDVPGSSAWTLAYNIYATPLQAQLHRVQRTDRSPSPYLVRMCIQSNMFYK